MVSGCAWVGLPWLANSFLSFLVLVESGYAGFILHGTKLQGQFSGLRKLLLSSEALYK